MKWYWLIVLISTLALIIGIVGILIVPSLMFTGVCRGVCAPVADFGTFVGTYWYAFMGVIAVFTLYGLQKDKQQ